MFAIPETLAAIRALYFDGRQRREVTLCHGEVK